MAKDKKGKDREKGIKFDLTVAEEYKNLTDEEILERFKKQVLPVIVKKLRTGKNGTWAYANGDVQ